MARTITTQSFVPIGLTIAELQKNKYVATLNKKIKGIVQGPVTTGPTTQSFVKIRPGISECIAGQTDIQT